MDWSKGYSSRYYMTVVDPVTWRDISTVQITGGTISRSPTDLRESATIDCVNYSETKEQLIRVWLDTAQNANASHIPLFTGIATSPRKNITGQIVKSTLECYSVLKPAQDIRMPRGWYAARGMDGAKVISKLLKQSTNAKIEVADNSPALQTNIIALDGENNLSMVDALLDAINWRLIIRGDGSLYIGPYNRNPVVSFDSITNDVLEKDFSIEYDWYNCPNVFRAVVDDISVVARDTDPESPFSIQNRGREIWAEETNCNLNDSESIAAYADRRLKELQTTYTRVNYSRRYRPDIFVTDVVGINYPKHNLTGKFMVQSQSITLGYSARTSEEVVAL